jgi:vitamin B12 transporter
MSTFPALAAPLTAALLALPIAQAEEPTELDPVVVTATRTPEPETQTLASVTVIDRAEIERRQARSVPDLLRGLAGVTVTGSGGPGQPASVLVRGTDADQVLVLIDGVKMGSATLGSVQFENLPIAQIERIELVRGPRSSLYGSEAIGGVIQIFTRKGGGPLTPRVSVGAGTYETASGSLGLSGGGDKGWFNLGGSLEQTEGFNACNGRPDPFAGCGVFEPDKDGYRNRSVSARGGYRLNERVELDAHLLQSDNEVDFDGGPFSGNSARSEQRVLGASARLKPLEPWTLTLAGGRSWDQYRAFFEDAFLGRFDTERDTLTLQNDLALAPGQLLTLGVDYQEDRVDGTIDYTEDSRDNTGLFGQYQGRWGDLDAKLSLRQDDNQQFGTQGTGNAALGYGFAGGLRVVASYGTAYKAPTFNDLYYPFFGNPDLDPEQSRSSELEVSGGLPAGRWSLSLYQTTIDELIAFDPFTFQVANIDEALIRGLEASTSLGLRDWGLGGNLTLMDPENRSEGSNEGNLLPRRPEQALSLDLDRRIGTWSIGATVNRIGRRFDDLANQVRLDPYTLVGLRAEYALSESLRLQARLDNLLDEDYETAAFYNQPGRGFYLTVRYEPPASSE